MQHLSAAYSGGLEAGLYFHSELSAAEQRNPRSVEVTTGLPAFGRPEDTQPEILEEVAGS